MKRYSRFLALLLAAMMLLASIPAAFAESLPLNTLTAEEYYGLRDDAGNLFDDLFWNPIIQNKIEKANSLEEAETILKAQNDNEIYRDLAKKTVDRNFYPVISDENRAKVDGKLAELYANDMNASATLREAYEKQNLLGNVAALLGNGAQENVDAKITEEQKNTVEARMVQLVDGFVQELAVAGSQEQFAQLLAFMTDEQKLDFLNRMTEAQYGLIRGYADNYLWPGQVFTIAEEASFTGGLRVNGSLISGDALRDYLFGLGERAFQVAVNQMNIDQAGSLEARVSDSQASAIAAAMCHAGFYVGGSSAPVQKSVRAAAAQAENGAEQPVWPNEGAIKLDKDAKAVEGAENLWEVTLQIQGKNYTTTSDVVLVIDCSGSMEGTKLANTCKAAKAFGEKLLTAGSTSRIAIVTYIDKATAYNDGHFYDANELGAFEAAVESATYADGGTNQQAGIHEAQQLLSSSASTGELKNIVILSDGEPTYSYRFTATADYIDCDAWTTLGCPRGGKFANIRNVQADYNTVIGSGGSFSIWNGNLQVTATCSKHGGSRTRGYVYSLDGTVNRNGEANNGIATIWEANQAKAAGTTIYSIALQAGTNGENTLRACASDSSDYFAIASSDNVEEKLTKAFEKVAGSIAIAASNGAVADTMGDKVQLQFTGSAPVITNDKDVYDAGNADVYISQGTAAYDAGTRQINWTVGNVREGDVSTLMYKVKIGDGVSPSTGETLYTNKKATFSYTNYQGTKTEKEFPKPQVTVGGGTILVHYYLVNENGEPINEEGVAVESPSLAKQVKEAGYHEVDGKTGLNYNTPYKVEPADIADYEYFGSYNLNDDELTAGNNVTVTLSAANSNQHVWFAYKEKPKNGNLTIQKAGWQTIDPDQSFVFTVSGNGVELEVVIHENGSATIRDLPVGTYTVTENQQWSWRYTTENSQTVEIKGGDNEELTFTNERKQTQWLDGNAHLDNQWGKAQSN